MMAIDGIGCVVVCIWSVWYVRIDCPRLRMHRLPANMLVMCKVININCQVINARYSTQPLRSLRRPRYLRHLSNQSFAADPFFFLELSFVFVSHQG